VKFWAKNLDSEHGKKVTQGHTISWAISYCKVASLFCQGACRDGASC